MMHVSVPPQCLPDLFCATDDLKDVLLLRLLSVVLQVLLLQLVVSPVCLLYFSSYEDVRSGAVHKFRDRIISQCPISHEDRVQANNVIVTIQQLINWAVATKTFH